jgi:predicted RecA/RadA family phage recombinase
MSKNQVYAGSRPALPLPVPAGTKSGEPVIVGGIVGVAETDRAATTNGVHTGPGLPDGYASVQPDGTYSLPVADAVSAAGTKIYIVTADRSLTTTASGNTLFGYTVPVIVRGVATGATKSSGAGNVNVAIAQTV